MGAGAVKAAPELTDWYGGKQRPERVGVYERQTSRNTNTYSMWDGGCWLSYMPTPESAAKQHISSWRQTSPWRGLAADPSKAGK